eukprot:bmy_09007T0
MASQRAACPGPIPRGPTVAPFRSLLCGKPVPAADNTGSVGCGCHHCRLGLRAGPVCKPCPLRRGRKGSHIHQGSCLLRPGAYLGSPAQHSPLHPVLVARDVLGVEQLVGGGVLAQPVLRRGAGVHEGLGHHREAGVSDAVLVDVKHKLGVLDHVDPKPQGQAVWREEADGQGSWGAGGHCTLTQRVPWRKRKGWEARVLRGLLYVISSLSGDVEISEVEQSVQRYSVDGHWRARCPAWTTGLTIFPENTRLWGPRQP